jgi:phosphoribosylanthranilate isomerase
MVTDIVPKTYLAGGLSAENVADAIRIVKPYAVDACSLLESEPGKKDHDKVACFITIAKGTL